MNEVTVLRQTPLPADGPGLDTATTDLWNAELMVTTTPPVSSWLPADAHPAADFAP